MTNRRRDMSAMRKLVLMYCLFLAQPVVADELNTVLIVSIDALHPAALGESTSPTLQSLMRSGRFTLNGQSVTPPLTLIAHTAMMTGLSPVQNGKQDNDWKPGAPQVARETLLDVAKQQGFGTAYFYAKQKLGYLVSKSIDVYALARDDGVERARAFFVEPGKRFVFLHISGLEDAGTDSGWLSAEYLNELTQIDRDLAPLVSEVLHRGSYLVVVTSDHAGHARLHGTNDPEDLKLPVILASDQRLPQIAPGIFHITELKNFVQGMLLSKKP